MSELITGARSTTNIGENRVKPDLSPHKKPKKGKKTKKGVRYASRLH